jgi:hypothetical protein
MHALRTHQIKSGARIRSNKSPPADGCRDEPSAFRFFVCPRDSANIDPDQIRQIPVGGQLIARPQKSAADVLFQPIDNRAVFRLTDIRQSRLPHTPSS